MRILPVVLLLSAVAAVPAAQSMRPAASAAPTVSGAQPAAMAQTARPSASQASGARPPAPGAAAGGPAPGTAAATPLPPVLDREAQRWVTQTLAAMSADERIGQLIVPAFNATYLPTDTETYDTLVRTVTATHAGGVIAFGGTEPAPQVLLNPTYGTVVLGQPHALASTLNRLQAVSRVPLLVSSDFEYGAGMRIAGATRLPRAMAIGATGDPKLAYEAARVTAREARAMGVHMNYGPVADVNNNPRNPVINTRAFGEDPARVAAMVEASVRGLQDGGVLATLKHFPGHGDTDVDSHLGLPLIPHPRTRLVAVELPPFLAGLRAGAAAVMVAHIELPALDATAGPATFSRAVVTGLLRDEMRFGGLVVTDAMKMDAITRMVGPGEAAVKAVQAGADLVLDSPDPIAAFEGLKAAVEGGAIPRERIEASARRILEAKARLGLHRGRMVSMDAVADQVGGRAGAEVAQRISARAITRVRGDTSGSEWQPSSTRRVLYLSLLDYPSGWRIAAPARTLIPALRARWPRLESVELSDRSTAAELDLVRTLASQADAVVLGVFVRASSGSGRMDLAPGLLRLVQQLTRASGARSQPVAALVFGNPYTASALSEVPTVLLTYDFSDLAEQHAVEVLAGERAAQGVLPVSLGESPASGPGNRGPAPR